MGLFKAKSSASEVILEIKVTKEDGTIIDHGEVAHYYRNPWKRWWYKIHRKGGIITWPQR